MPHQVLSIKPDGSFTHNASAFQKDGTDSEVAKIQYRRFKEEGTITLSHPSKTYNVLHSINSGVWRLQLDDPHAENKPLIVATKPKWYRNTVTFEMDGDMYEMVRPSIMKRDYHVGRLRKDDMTEASGVDDDKKTRKGEKIPPGTLRGTKIGELLTDGALKRSYTVTFDDDIGIELLLFCYWLVSLFNKRSNASHSGGGGGSSSGSC